MDLSKTIDGLVMAGEWIRGMVGGDFNKSHRFYCKSIENAVEILEKIKRAYEKYNEVVVSYGYDAISVEEFLNWIYDMADEF